MNAITVIISFLTAFIITAGGSVGIAFIATNGAMPSKAVWISASILGLGAAAKDTRSLLKLPPVDSTNPQPK